MLQIKIGQNPYFLFTPPTLITLKKGELYTKNSYYINYVG